MLLDPHTAAATGTAASTAQRLLEFAGLIEQGQRILVALAGFVTVGLGGVFLAIRKVLQSTRDVGNAVEPVRHEITGRGSDTLSQRVDIIVSRIDSIDVEREQQHADNSARLDRIEGRMDSMASDISAIRRVMDRILTKLAGLT